MKPLFLFFLLFCCATGGWAYTVTFSVDMRQQVVQPGGVHIAGTFQAVAGFPADWDPATTLMTDANNDSIYEYTANLPAGMYRYKFINGTDWVTSELVPATCGENDGSGNINRLVQVAQDVAFAPVCFSACTACAAIPPPAPPVYTTGWWNDAVFYEVFVRSFYDSTGDGKGDFAGLMAKLDYLNDGNPATTTDLGITALWLMPIMSSPSYHGYDVANYKATEPDYGTVAQFQAFLAAAHARGIRVILDFVMNHSSSQHAWFTQSASGPASPYRDWYTWSSTNPGYTGPWGEDVWHRRGSNYYYGVFTGEMPDLNWRNPATKSAIFDAAAFWLNMGVDGFRLDAVKYLVEDNLVSANPILLDAPQTLSAIEQFQDTIARVRPDVFTVGEAWSGTPTVVPYVQDGRLSACFEFQLAAYLLYSLQNGDPSYVNYQLGQVASSYPQLRYGVFLTNHDQDRVYDQLGGNMALLRQAAALYLTMPGVPFLYYGEEIGMRGNGADENKRTPMQWTATRNGGFTRGTPWEALNTNYAQYNVAAQQTDPASLLNHYKKLIAVRTGSEQLRKGYYLAASALQSQVLVYGRVYNDEAVLVASNFSADSVPNAALAVSESFLPEGVYYATELYTGQAAGAVRVGAQGQIDAWAPTLRTLAGNGTWILHLSRTPTYAHTIVAPSLSMYPNPTADNLIIRLNGVQPYAAAVTLYDLQGKAVLAQPIQNEQTRLDVSALPPGTYLARVQTPTHTWTQKVVIAR